MKTILLLSLTAILANASFGADEPVPLLQPGKDYALGFLDTARLSMTGPVRVLSNPQNGWVRIEYTPYEPRVAPPGPVAPEKPPGKRQVWLNIAHVLTIQDWDAALQEIEQRKASRARQ